MCPSDTPDFTWPSWIEGEQAVLFVWTQDGVQIHWRNPSAYKPQEWVATWLHKHKERLDQEELNGLEEYAALDFDHAPTTNPDGLVAGESPVRAFGYGLLCVENERVAQLSTLIAEAVVSLRGA